VLSSVLQSNQSTEKKIGIAMPGPFDYENGISLIEDQDKFKLLYKINIKNNLADRLCIPSDCIRFMNDASCFLQGEVFGGAAQNYNPVLGLTLGTGLGSAFCKEGIAQDADLWNSPFREGIAEDYLSTRWFVGRYGELTGRTISGVKELMETETSTTIRETLFQEFSENLALFLIPQIQKFSAEAVVFGGNISNAFAFFQPALEASLREGNSNVVLKRAILNEDASLLGAASCWSLVDVAKETKEVPHVSRT
ncbi:MAG: ROK family protein, partial [Bacteroidota bacterium]|nr:ROK family protein [Bacteroidota bacterium]